VHTATGPFYLFWINYIWHLFGPNKKTNLPAQANPIQP
jgi:cbb3-type cytochrome oxidase subunit 3